MLRNISPLFCFCITIFVEHVTRLIPGCSTDCGPNGGEVRSPRYRNTSSDEGNK